MRKLAGPVGVLADRNDENRYEFEVLIALFSICSRNLDTRDAEYALNFRVFTAS